jgi:hypothetical protein
VLFSIAAALPLVVIGAKQKAPKQFGALVYYYKYSNDITNPVKRLYATTTEYLFAVSF